MVATVLYGVLVRMVFSLEFLPLFAYGVHPRLTRHTDSIVPIKNVATSTGYSMQCSFKCKIYFLVTCTLFLAAVDMHLESGCRKKNHLLFHF